MNTNILNLVSGDAVDINLEFRDKNDDLLNMSGCKVFLTAKDMNKNIILTKDSEAPLPDDPLTKQIEWEDIENGQAIIHFTEADSQGYDGVYDYDIQITKDSHPYTPIKSFLIISEDITE